MDDGVQDGLKFVVKGQTVHNLTDDRGVINWDMVKASAYFIGTTNTWVKITEDIINNMSGEAPRENASAFGIGGYPGDVYYAYGGQGVDEGSRVNT